MDFVARGVKVIIDEVRTISINLLSTADPGRPMGNLQLLGEDDLETQMRLYSSRIHLGSRATHAA